MTETVASPDPSGPHRVVRHAERARHERVDLDAVLDDGHHVGSLSTVVDGRPWVVPMLYGRAGDRVVLHGSVAAGALSHVAEGATAALCVTHLDAWVFAHTLFDSSANYRSAVVQGELRTATGDEAAALLDALSAGLFPGRRDEVGGHTRKHLAATQCLVMDIEPGRWTVKVRDGGPGETRDEVPDDLWTGTLAIRSVYGDPVAADGVGPEVPVSPSVVAMRDRSPG